LRAVLYCRVSGDDQNIESQIDFAVRHCKLHEIAIHEIYKDDGVSSLHYKLEQRPEGARLLADAKAGKFDTILVFKVDRLIRGSVASTAELLREYGVTIRSLTEPFDTSTPAGKLLLNMLGEMGEFERSNIIERSRSGMERIVRAGQWAGGVPPFGYCVGADKKLALDTAQSEIVKDIFRWYLSGALRVRGIAQRLNAADVKHSISRRWWDTTVSKLLRNRAYVGELIWRKRTNRRRVGGKWTCVKTTKEQQITIAIPPIISQKDFDPVQRMLTANQRGSFRNVKNFYLLRGLIFCRQCGSKYRGMTSGRKPWIKTYYRCASHIGTSQIPPCRGKAVRADILDAAVWETCLSFAQDPGQVIEELRAVMQTTQNVQHESRALVASLEKQITKIKQGRADTIRLHRLGVITQEETERDLAALEGEVKALNEHRQEILVAVESSEDAEFKLLSVESMLNLLAERISSLSLDAMREVVLSWVSRIEIETVSEGKTDRGVAHVSFAFGASPAAVAFVGRGVATSSARLAACWPRTSRKSTA
jgi:site-specific DNA recombinase